MNLGAWDAELRVGLNPLLIGAQCERNADILHVPAGGLNPLLIGAQCELVSVIDNSVHFPCLNPLLIGAQCELGLR